MNAPPVAIEVRSILRFVRQFETAVNIMVRTEHETRFTFVLMLALPLDTNYVASVYAVRLFRGDEADAVTNILDHVYRINAVADDDEDDETTVQAQLDARLYRHWINQFPDSAQPVPTFPNVYLFFFVPDTYRTDNIETQIQASRAFPHLDRDLYRETVQDDDAPPLLLVDDNDFDESLTALNEKAETEVDKAIGNELFQPSTERQQRSANRVDLLGFAEWLDRNKKSSDERTVWIEAHHRVDQVLFDRERLARMFDRLPDPRLAHGLPTISRNWTLPFLRLLMSRKLNDTLASKLLLDPCFTHVDFYDNSLERTRVQRQFAVSRKQCRSRHGMNLVLPCEWIESPIVPWSRLFDRFGAHVCRPNGDFTLLRLYSHEHPFAQRTTEQHFWLNTRSLDRPSAAVRPPTIALLQQMFSSSSSSAESPLQRLLDSLKRRRDEDDDEEKASTFFFAVDEQEYGTENEPTDQRKIRFVSAFARITRRNAKTSTRLYQQRDNNNSNSSSKKPLPLNTLICNSFRHWEQSILLDYGLRFLDDEHPINVNGDPGTGKSTVLWFLLQIFARPVCAVPTNKLKHQFADKLSALLQAGHLDSTAVTAQTLSSCVKRLGCFRLPPQLYSRILVNQLTDSLTRSYRLQAHPDSRFDHRLFNTGLGWGNSTTDNCTFVNPKLAAAIAPDQHVAAPDVLMLDESNLCLWQHVIFLLRNLQRLRCRLMLFGDSGQNRPIDSTPDNAELINLGCSLSVQLLANKRLNGDNGDTAALGRVLRDSVWQLVTSRDDPSVNQAIGNYIRGLLRRHFHRLLDVRRLTLDTEVIDWCDGIARLHEFYRARPACWRYVSTAEQALAIARAVPRISPWFLIAQTNQICDRFNHYYLLAHHRELMRRVFTPDRADRSMFLLYSVATVRQCYLPRDQLPLIPSDQITFQDRRYNPRLDPVYGIPHSRLSRVERERRVHGTILDDPWSSVLRLCVGFHYTYVGGAACIPPGSILRLLAILPDREHDRRFLCSRAECDTCGRMKTTQTRKSFNDEISTIGGLLMELVRVPSSGASEGSTTTTTSTATVNIDDLLVVTQEYYRVSRYNSLWCDSPRRKTDRLGAYLYGYPLRQHNSMTTYKVQGETLYRELYPHVCIDLTGMEREAILVAISRLTTEQQLRSILNADKCCPSTPASSSFFRTSKRAR